MPDVILVKDAPPKFQAHPEGMYVGLCVDSIDMGERVKTYPGAPTRLVPMCSLVFRTGHKNDAGEYLDIQQEFAQSMGEKANLRHFLESWRGKSYTAEQLEAGVSLDKLAGQYALLTIEQKTSPTSKRTYAVIRSVSPVPPVMPKPEFPAYERPEYLMERKAEYATEATAYRTAISVRPVADYEAPAAADDDDELPF